MDTYIDAKHISSWKNNKVTIPKKAQIYRWRVPNKQKIQVGDLVWVPAKKMLSLVCVIQVVQTKDDRSHRCIVKIVKKKQPQVKKKKTGYIKNIRSRRSQKAIDNYIVPISHIDRKLVDSFLKKQQKEEIQSFPIRLWKFAAKQIGPNCWHHTSPFFNKTNHYSLHAIADSFLQIGRERWEIFYEKHQQDGDLTIQKEFPEINCMTEWEKVVLEKPATPTPNQKAYRVLLSEVKDLPIKKRIKYKTNYFRNSFNRTEKITSQYVSKLKRRYPHLKLRLMFHDNLMVKNTYGTWLLINCEYMVEVQRESDIWRTEDVFRNYAEALDYLSNRKFWYERVTNIATVHEA